MGFLSGVRALHASGWILVIWFISASSSAGSKDVMLQVEPQVMSECGKNMTLTCTANSPRQLDIKLFSWITKKTTVCQYNETSAVCEYTKTDSQHRLTLTLMNVMPVHAGKYLCKLQSQVGANDSSTVVTIQDCLESTDSHINESHVECRFTGVYPSGTVHWFRGDVNLTDSASTREGKDERGRFSVSSDLNVQEGNVSLPYNCSLWIPSGGRYASSKTFIISRKTKSSGSTVRLQWICGVVWIVCVLVGKV